MHRARLLRAGQAEDRLGDPEAKDALVSALVNDASAVVEAFRDAELEEQSRRRWRCWRWSPGRTSSPPKAPMAGTGGGGSPQGGEG